MGKTECSKTYYHNDETMEECFVNDRRIIEIYGFSSDLKTVDLMTQFKAFRKVYFKVIWVDDTHSLGLFDSSYLGNY